MSSTGTVTDKLATTSQGGYSDDGLPYGTQQPPTSGGFRFGQLPQQQTEDQLLQEQNAENIAYANSGRGAHAVGASP